MKSKLILISIAIIILFALPACCSSCESLTAVQQIVSCDAFMENNHFTGEVEIAVDGELTVVLCSNPSTGFEWPDSAEISDQTVLEQTDHEYNAPEGEGDEPPAPGTPGTETWTFRALKEGTAEVSMEYSQPWEGGEKAWWTFVLTVVVK